MDEKTKLYIFTKKEVALIFLFMVLIGCTSFILGVNVGKNYSFTQAGFLPEDHKKLELMSEKEESVEKIVQKESAQSPEEQAEVIDSTYKRLEEEFKKLDQTDQNKNSTSKNVKKVEDAVAAVATNSDVTAVQSKKEVERDVYTGKYTIQLGSHRSVQEAEKFADGFRVRGYDPIIDEVTLKDRGVWYRVSLGVFENVKEAKAYVEREKSLFSGTDYVFVQFD